MHHSFWDKYSNLDSLIHKLDCRTKTVLFSLFVLAIVSTPGEDILRLALFGAVISSIVLLSRIPLTYILKRSLITIPFVLLIAFFIIFFNGNTIVASLNLGFFNINIYKEGLQVFQSILIKSWLSFLCVLILAETTAFNYLLKGFEKLKFPRIIIMVISFFYRYVFILIDQLDMMHHAVESRGFKGNLKWRINVIGSMLGWLFISTYGRAERVYMAMLSRGFSGSINTLKQLKFSKLDIIFSFVLLTILTYVRIGRF